MSNAESTVIALDDDPLILASLEALLAVSGFKVRIHSDPDDFLKAGIPSGPACLLLDNNLGNGVTGVQVHQQILDRGWHIPTIFLTGDWDVQLVVKAMRAGADGFLTKPYEPQQLIAEVNLALQRSVEYLSHQAKEDDARKRSATLTEREKQIVILVAQGLLNKEIADQLGLALITVKVHRGHAMRKMGAGNPAELAHSAALAGLI